MSSGDSPEASAVATLAGSGGVAAQAQRDARLLALSRTLLCITDKLGVARYWSPGVAELLGVGEGDLRDLSRVHPDDVTRLRHQLGELSAHPDATLRATYRLRHADGSWRTFDASITNHVNDPAIGGLLASLQDITEQEKAQEALKRSEQYYRELLSHLPGAIAVHRLERIIYANRALSELTGFTGPELRGQTLFDLVAPEERQDARQRLTAVLGGKPATKWDGHIVSKLGRLLVVEVTPILLNLDDGPAVLTFMRDITEIQRVQEQIMRADRMISVGTLAGGVAHEINNPLSYVIGNLAFVQEQLTQFQSSGEAVDWSEVLAAVQDSREGLDRVRRIIRDLRTFAASGESRGPVDVRAVMERCLNLASAEIRHCAHLVTDYSTVPDVEGNEVRVSQVFLNLLMNAVQAIAPGEPDQHELKVVIRPGVRGVDVSIIDTGSGIQSDVLPRIFDPFFTTKPVGAATGLGLSICHSIVKAMGGTIRVSTEVGQGTTVTVELPARPS